jgi:hypothetical protein
MHLQGSESKVEICLRITPYNRPKSRPFGKKMYVRVQREGQETEISIVA